MQQLLILRSNETLQHFINQQGVFQTLYPDQTARVVLSLLEDLGYATVEVILSGEREPDDLPRLERIVTATVDALERVLGAPAGCLLSSVPWLVLL